MESALRTAHFLITGKDLWSNNFEEVRRYRGIKEAEVRLENVSLIESGDQKDRG